MNKNISRGLIVGALTVLAAAPATGAFAASHASTHRPATAGHGQTHRPTKPIPVVTGTVTAQDATATVTVSRPAPHHTSKIQTFTVTATAKITRNDVAATFADLTVGDHISAKVQTVSGVLTGLPGQRRSTRGCDVTGSTSG